MKTGLTFDDVCKFVRGTHPELREDIDALSSLLVLSSSFFFLGPSTTVLAALGILSDLLGVKDGIVKIGERIFTRITERDGDDPVDKQRRMQIAYVLICYTAFFDTLDASLPEIMRELKLRRSEKELLSEASLQRLMIRQTDQEAQEGSPDIIRKELDLPHPAFSFQVQKQQLAPLYQELSSGFAKFLEGFALWEKAKETTRAEIKRSLQNLPDQAYERFEAQYYALATKYEEFFMWANLHEHAETQEKLQTMSAYVRKHVELATNQSNTADIGMKRLTELVALMPGAVVAHQANKAIQEIDTLYTNRIEEPVVNDIIEARTAQDQVAFPKKSEIFVPQAFQVMRYAGKPLEDELTWNTAPVRDDLGTFLMTYMSSPYSTGNLLIILGHPGSGKSLLTHIIAARLMASPYTPIRVVLRDIEADSEISVQIEEQIKKDTGREVSWASLADTLSEKPALVMFDGYDELLQASGKVYSGYLRKVQKFQENEGYLGRQLVRTIVTSRITLIDKADIPQGATIIRLQPFDKDKREQWASVWNNTNKRYYEQSGVQPFTVPQAGKLLQLAEQPLLLLMLAIYDSEKNQLHDSGHLDQTFLYDSLLRRFINRERMKDQVFLDMPGKDRAIEIEYEMERLGVAALGMFNRRKLHIKVSEMNRDLSFFRLERKSEKPSGLALSQADLLLGSFFFVHESRSRNMNEETGDRGQDVAFEFLHNTFGEFLATEFIVRKVVKECITLFRLSSAQLEEERLNKLNRTDEFPVVCLAYVPLFARPNILEMMREWINHKLARDKFCKTDFLNELDAIISSELKRLLTQNKLAAVLTGTLEDNPFPSFPTTGHVAIYSLNLILLRAVLSPDGYVFDEDEILSYPDGTRAWDRLTFLWRSWFSMESLEGAAAVIISRRHENHIHLEIKETFSTLTSSTRLDSVLNIATALSDNALAGTVGLLTYDAYKPNPGSIEDYERRLKTEGIDLELEILTRKLRSLDLYPDFQTAQELLAQAITILRGTVVEDATNQETVVTVLKESIRIAQKFFGKTFAIEVFDQFYAHHAEGMLLSVGSPLMVVGLRLGLEIGNLPFLRWYFEQIRGLLHKQKGMYELSSELIVGTIKLLRRFGNETLLEDFYREYVSERRTMRELPLELLIEVLKLAHEFGDRSFMEYFYREHVHNWTTRDLTPREWQIMPDLPPLLMVEMLKLAHEVGDTSFLKYFYRKHVSGWYPLSELPPELLVEVLKLACESNDTDFLERFDKELLGTKPAVLDFPTQLALEAIDVVREFNKSYARRIYEWYFHSPGWNLSSVSLKHLKNIHIIASEFNDDETLRQIERGLEMILKI